MLGPPSTRAEDAHSQVPALACFVVGRPRTPLAAIVVVFAAWVIRGIDGYCSPLLYRRIYALSGSVDVLQWAGILAIYLVMVGVWVTLVIVIAGEYS